jgi:predicted metal-binding membrane protein
VTAGAARARPADRGAWVSALALAAVAALSWAGVLRGSRMPMSAPGPAASLPEAAAFTAAWGIMMAAMMLPGAAPVILLYHTVRRRLAADGERAIPSWAFAAVYLAAWTAMGVAVYAGYVAVAWAAARWPGFGAVTPRLVALTLAAAGVYQFTAAKRACLRYCESPLDLLMRKWRGGYRATIRLAAEHAAYCLGCCWGLMLVLVAAGAMSLPWVLVIALVVSAEKLLPPRAASTRLVGAALLALAAAVALRPSLAATLRGGEMEMSTAPPGAMPGMGETARRRDP